MTAQVFVALLGLGWVGAHAQDPAAKPRRIVTIEAGGGNDTAARLTAQAWSNSLGQRVIVENRAGASGVIAAETVIKAAPDGLTLLSMSSSLWILPLMQSVPYDPVKDLQPRHLGGQFAQHPRGESRATGEVRARVDRAGEGAPWATQLLHRRHRLCGASGHRVV